MSTSIIEFSVENFKIFQKKVSFSMFARKSSHTFVNNEQNLLRTSLIYGPNASGKTSLLSAFRILKKEIVNSTNNLGDSKLPYYPFILSNGKSKPSFFEVIFSFGDKIFKYNFSILSNEIITENLLEILSTGKEKNYLTRKKQVIKVFNGFKKSEDVKYKTRKEVLFLSAASQWNNALAMEIIRFFGNVNFISGPDSDGYRGYTINLFKNNIDKKKSILKFLKMADFCIDDGVVEKTELPDFVKNQIELNFKSEALKNIQEVDTVSFMHNKFDLKNNKIGTEKINMIDESNGTQKFFDILGPVVDTLENGKILLIDEFDNSLHPLLTKFIVDLFEKNNPKNAQLIATTHDTSLLSCNDFIKDQFWFTEKDKFGSGKLFSLAEFSLRNDTEYSKKYLEGRFGALPFIKSL